MGVGLGDGDGGSSVGTGAGEPHAIHTLKGSTISISSINKYGVALLFLRRATTENNASGPMIAPIGFHGTQGLRASGLTPRVRNLPVAGSHLHCTERSAVQV